MKSQKQSTKNSKLTKGKKLINNKKFIVGLIIGVVLVISGIIAFAYNSVSYTHLTLPTIGG